MPETTQFDVIIIGGSYAGLSAAMALGRALRKVLVIDSGLPCNRQTPHSHNFITQDGEKPQDIAEKARAQVMKYDTVQFHYALANSGKQIENGFSITTEEGKVFTSKKLIFATGIKDIMPDIPGFSACWGISVIHCPYCHGYEVKGVPTGILANGDVAYHYAQLIRNWTRDLTVFTNGKSTLTPEQSERISKHNIHIVEKEIDHLKHNNGHLSQVQFKDNTSLDVTAIYSRPEQKQHCPIPEMLGCELTEHGFIKVEMTQKTTVEGVFACGDNSSPMRSVANAVASGNLVGAMANHELTSEEF
ncbi:NAD(P)/FAD-dependent oxidoreductase [Arthrospiribacter ruber]|uniref:NAD(P)/FAD-dependent oxidoreductase n=1 Tax=Arthrospiribacter ruber TaxID=2487934 RepID=A0A951J6E6_9BACT|nr:NAD(P)/FAD-dependent oxidoreductase [Arthrospiribacter ruber]MBW3470468.1 NAD(P)/FAD-dependent oxidoreductase [Arthrospiribacter ruber]